MLPFLLLVACASAARPADTPLASGARIENAGAGCSAVLPPGWVGRVKNLREGQVFLAHRGGQAYLQLRIEREFAPGPGEEFWNPLEMHANAQMSGELRMHRRFKVSSVKSGKWRDSETIERIALWEGPSSERIKGRRTWFVHDMRIWCLVFHAPETGYAAALPDADRVRESLALPTPRPGSVVGR